MTTTSAQTEKPRSARSVGDMIRTLAVVGAIVAVMIVVNYRAPEDPVKQIDPGPMAAEVATVAPFPVLMPTDPGWRPTAARWEPTQSSQPDDVWFVGGVYSAEGPFASLSQSAAVDEDYIAEQTGNGTVDGTPLGTGALIAGQQWGRYESEGNRSLVLVSPTSSTIVTGTGTWDQLERFAGSLRDVGTVG